jgi:hypothetical protein
MKVTRDLDQGSWLRTSATKPPTKRLPSDVGALPMPETNDVDQRAFSQIQPHFEALTDIGSLISAFYAEISIAAAENSGHNHRK